MRFTLNNLNPYDFEHLVQALCRRILGSGTISFGDGPDGGREATYQGVAPFPSIANVWSGYWVVQAKFKAVNSPADATDYAWVEGQLEQEFKKSETRVIRVPKPDIYLLFTNVRLTGVASTGGRDKASELERRMEETYGVQHVRIISHDDIADYLNNYRDIATSFAPFILPGDVLYKLLELLDVNEQRKARITETISRFFEVEFKEDIQSRLDHAGKLTSDKVSLEKVFIDLYATPDGNVRTESERFIASTIKLGNRILKSSGPSQKLPNNRFVLIAGPGYGKSTLTQFLCQVYRAFFLGDADKQAVAPEVRQFLADSEGLIKERPSWGRLPFRIVLKEYAGWIKEQTGPEQESVSVITYLTHCIRKKAGGQLLDEDVERVITSASCLFVFDGLDEVPVTSNRSKVIGEINTFSDTVLRRANADVIVVATSRPQGYSKEFDPSKYEHLQLTDLTKEDCRLYLGKLMEYIVDELSERERKLAMLDRALDSPEISRVMRSPLQASIMAILVKSGGEPPTNKFDLFRDYYDIIFRREKQRNISPVLNEHPDYVKEIHNRLGLYLQVVSENESNPSATITMEKFCELVDGYLESLELEAAEVALYRSQVIDAAVNRLVFISEVEDQRIGFAIRSLQEFFAANGYIHNVADKELVARIKRMGYSAYWSNTLLFAIGYLYANKNYLTDIVESLCHELNGSTDAGDERSLSALSRMGSWLALSILNEGIFKGNPKNENKFCNLLQPLFEVATTARHGELSRLPEKVIDRSVMGQLKEAIGGQSMSAWRTVTLLKDQGMLLGELVQQHWPDSIPEQLQVAEYLLGRGTVPDAIIPKVDHLFAHAPKDKLWQLLRVMSSNAVEKVFRNMPEGRGKAVFAEIAIMDGLFDYGDVGFWQFQAMGIYKFGQEYHPLYDASKRFSTSLTYYYSYEIIKTPIAVSPELEMLRAFAMKLDLKLVLALFDFLLQPTLEAFIMFRDILTAEEPAYAKIVRQGLQPVNSFFYIVFDPGYKGSDADMGALLTLIDNFEEFSATPEEAIRQRRLLPVPTGVIASDQALSIFFDAYLEEQQSEDALMELYDLSADVLLSTDVIWVKDNKMLTGTIAAASAIAVRQKPPRDIAGWLPACFFLPVGELANLLDEAADNHVELAFGGYGMFFAKKESVYLHSSYDKLCDVVKLQMLTAKRPSIRSLVAFTQILLEGGARAPKRVLPFRELLGYAAGGDAANYIACLLLADPDFAAKHAGIFRQTFTTAPPGDEIKRLILFFLKYAVNNPYVDSIYLFVEALISPRETKLRAEFESLVYQYVAAKPTGITLPF